MTCSVTVRQDNLCTLQRCSSPRKSNLVPLLCSSDCALAGYTPAYLMLALPVGHPGLATAR